MAQAIAGRRFVPPAVAVFAGGGGSDVAAAEALHRARDGAFAEGRQHGLRQGHVEGRREGEAETRETMQREIDALRSEYALLDQRVSVTAALDQVLAARALDLAALEQATRTAVVAALRSLFPTLQSHRAGAEIEAVLQQALTERPAETLRLRAHPATLDAIAAEAAGCGDPGRVALEPDASLAPGAAEIAWTGGGLTFEPARLLEHVVAMLEAMPPLNAAAVPSSEETEKPADETVKLLDETNKEPST